MSYPTALQTKKATRLLLGWPSLPLFLCDRCLADTSPRLPILFGVRDSGCYGKGHVYSISRKVRLCTNSRQWGLSVEMGCS